MNNTCYIPRTYLRHHRQFRALLIGHQAWFSALDLSRLLSCHFNARLPSMLDEDQSRRENLRDANGAFNEELLLSESGVYNLLAVQFYHPENRNLRQWITHEVVADLRGAAGQ